jgi:hypothetical protein
VQQLTTTPIHPFPFTTYFVRHTAINFAAVTLRLSNSIVKESRRLLTRSPLFTMSHTAPQLTPSRLQRRFTQNYAYIHTGAYTKYHTAFHPPSFATLTIYATILWIYAQEHHPFIPHTHCFVSSLAHGACGQYTTDNTTGSSASCSYPSRPCKHYQRNFHPYGTHTQSWKHYTHTTHHPPPLPRSNSLQTNSDDDTHLRGSAFVSGKYPEAPRPLLSQHKQRRPHSFHRFTIGSCTGHTTPSLLHHRSLHS